MTLKILAVHRYRPDMPSLAGFTTARCSPADTPPSLSPSPLRPPAIPTSRCQPRPHNSNCLLLHFGHLLFQPRDASLDRTIPNMPSLAGCTAARCSPTATTVLHFRHLRLKTVVRLDNCCHVDPEHCSHVDPEHLNSKPPCSFCEIPPFCKRT
jgi:hypothetical protein